MIRDPRGFTLAEVVVAAAIIGIGLTAVIMGFGYATSSVEAGRQQTTALFLAEQQLEDRRSRIIANFDLALAGVTQEAYNTIPNGAAYRRVTTITDFDLSVPVDGIIDVKRVQIDVFYRPITERGTLAERQVTLFTIVARR